MRKDIGAAGVGVVVRDHQGHAVVALTKRFHLPSTPAMIEALAAIAAVHLALELKLDQVSFEGDSETIIKALRCSEANFTSYGHITSPSLFKVAISNILVVQLILLPMFWHKSPFLLILIFCGCPICHMIDRKSVV